MPHMDLFRRMGCLVAVAALSAGAQVRGDVLRVPAQYATIQAAIDAAHEGDVVLVADGTYRGEGNRDIDFRGQAITLRSENGPATCIIECEGTAEAPHRGFRFHSGESPASILDGFTVRGGLAPREDEICKSSGGGILCRDGANPTIRNCIVTQNVTNDY